MLGVLQAVASLGMMRIFKIVQDYSFSQAVEMDGHLPNVDRTVLIMSMSSVGPTNRETIPRLARLWRELAPYGRVTLRRYLRPTLLGRRQIDRYVLQAVLVVHWAPNVGYDLPRAEARRLMAMELRRCAFRVLSSQGRIENSRYVR